MIDYKEGDWVKVVRGSEDSLPEGSQWEVYDSYVDEGFHYLALKDHPYNNGRNDRGENGWDVDRFILIKTKEHVDSESAQTKREEYVNFKRGDKVKIQQDMWEKHQATLTRLGFSAPNSFHGYEVSQVFENQKRISLKGCSNIYNSEYFELCAEEPTTEMTFKPDAVNSPKHYSVFEKLEAIEVIASSMTADQFYGYCLGNILKYRLRAGGKDDVMQELGKADRYQGLYNEFKHLCKAA